MQTILISMRAILSSEPKHKGTVNKCFHNHCLHITDKKYSSLLSPQM